MRFGFLGDDDDMAPLLGVIEDHPDHHVVGIGLVGPALNHSQQPLVEWESWLDGRQVDMVLVGGASEETAVASRQLANSGISIGLFPRARQDLGWVYELSLARDASPITLAAVLPFRHAGPIRDLRRRIRSGEIGDIQQIELERRFPKDALTAEDVAESLIYEIDLLRYLGGRYDQVSCLRAGSRDERFLQQTLTLSATGCPDATWVGRASKDGPSWRLTVHGDRQTAELHVAADAGSGPGGDRFGLPVGETVQVSGGDWSESEMARGIVAGLASGSASTDSWEQATRAFEVAEAAQRSVRRRRVIDLQFEMTSERTQFKTQMTAFGCLLLCLTPAAMLGYLLLARLPLPMWMLQVVRVVIFVPLFAFLGLQTLYFLARPSSQPTQNDSGPDRSSAGE